MLPRFHLNDFTTVGHYLGTVLGVCALLMLIPAVVGLALGELACAVNFIDGAGATMVIAALLRLLKHKRLDRRRSLLLCGVGWLAVGLVAAIPLYTSGGFSSYLDALFDAVSSITTTGVTLNSDIEHMSSAQITWRAILSLGGGLVIIVIALYLGFFGDGGYSARDNAKARRDTMSRSLRDTGRFIWVVAGTIVIAGTVIAVLILLAKGIPLKDAILNGFWLTTSAYSTGSFVPHTSSLIFYHSNWLNAFLAALMLLGGVGFGVFGMVLRKRYQLVLRNSELRAYIIWIVCLAILVTIILCRAGIFTSGTGLFTHGGFMVIASATTSGMQTVYPQQLGITFSDGALLIILAAMFVGACSNSSGGGVKVFRALQLMRWFAYTTKRTLLPERVEISSSYNHFGTKRMTSSDAMIAMVITSLFIAFAAFGTLAFIAHGYDALDSIGEALSYVSNTGLTTGLTDASMSLDLKIIAMVLMYLGRLEFVAILAILAGLFTSINPARSHIFNRSSGRKRSSKQNSKPKKRAKGAALSILLCLTLVGAGFAAVPLQARAASSEAQISAEDLPDLQLNRSYRVTTVEELLNSTQRMDGDDVEFSGEAIGYVVKANSKRVWVNVLSGRNMIAVLMSQSQAKKIQHWGAYCSQGDTVTVRGEFHLACAVHSGELEVHAASVNISTEGYSWDKPADTGGLVLGVVALAVGCLVIAAESLLRTRGGIRRKLRHLTKRRYNAANNKKGSK